MCECGLFSADASVVYSCEDIDTCLIMLAAGNRRSCIILTQEAEALMVRGQGVSDGLSRSDRS